jgi:hypothetical protein
MSVKIVECEEKDVKVICKSYIHKVIEEHGVLKAA